MKTPMDLGPNRTGVDMSPIDSRRSIDGARDGVLAPSTSTAAIDAVRRTWTAEAEPLGTMPPPASVKGVVVTAAELLKGNRPTVFLDLLGERLAFERTGTRLYEVVMVKLEEGRTRDADVAREDLERIRDQELRHFGLLASAMEQLGADPTAVTPSADVMAVATQGLLAVSSDPRVTLEQALKAVLIAELADNDGWLMLSDIAARLGHDEMAADFRLAVVDEQDHLARVRSWLTGAIDAHAGLTPQPRPSGPGIQPQAV